MPFDPLQPYPAFGGYPQAALTPLEPYPGLSAVYQQPTFGMGSYPVGDNAFGTYSPNGIYGAQAPYYPSNAAVASYQPSNSFNPSYGTYPSQSGSYPSTGFYPSSAGSYPSVGSYPSNIYNNGVYNPSSGSYNPSTSPVVASQQNPYQPSGLIPDPFGSVAPVLGSPSYKPPAIGSPSYIPPQITIIDGSSYKPSSSGYKPGNQDSGYDSVIVNAQGSYDQPYKPVVTGGYQPQTTYYRPPSSSSSSSNYRPSSSYQQQGYRPSIQGSIQEIPNTPSYYPSSSYSSQNRPATFYSATADQLLFPRE